MGQGLSACLVSASLMEEKSVYAIPRYVEARLQMTGVFFGLPVIPNLKDRGK